MIVSSDIYSIAVNEALDLISSGTTSIAFSIVRNGSSIDTEYEGLGSSLSIASVIIHSVPSEPMIRSLRS